ncbi:MAG: TolC family protein [Chthoniobacteraceae bacterium]
MWSQQDAPQKPATDAKPGAEQPEVQKPEDKPEGPQSKDPKADPKAPETPQQEVKQFSVDPPADLVRRETLKPAKAGKKSEERKEKDTGNGRLGAMSAAAVLDEVLRANLRLRGQKLERAIATQQLRGEWGIFEPDFIATLARETNNRQNTRQQFLSQGTSTFHERNQIASVGIETLLPTGGKVQLNAQNRKLRNNLQNPGEKESESVLGFTATQPLLKNAGWGATSAQIRLAAAQSKVIFQDYRKQLMLVLSQAEMSYWELVASRAFVGLREGSVRVAESVLTDNKARVVAGKMTEIEVLQAESGLAVRRAAMMDAGQKIVSSTSQLNAFFGRNGDTRARVMPLDSLSPPAPSRDLTASLMDAFRSHPMYLAQIEKCRQDDIRLAFTKNQRLPQLDLKASYGFNGLGDSFDHSSDVVGSGNFPSSYIGFEMRIPLGGGIKSRSQMNVAKLRKEQGLLELKAIEVELTNAVMSLVHKVSAAQEKAHSYREVVKVNERLLGTELTRLDEGKSDSRKVLQAEQDLADARISELDARLEWQRSYVELLVQTGTYLAKHNRDITENP